MTKGTDYTIDHKDEIRQLGRGGAVVTVYRIWATSKGGTYFHLDIPEADLEKVDGALTLKAKRLDSV